MKYIKNIIILAFIISFLTSCSFALELQGGVKYDVDTAREFVKQGQNKPVSLKTNVVFNQDDSNIKKALYSYNNSGDIIGITVLYKDEPDAAYIFGPNENLIYIDKYDKDVDIYPHRGYRYDLDENLVLTSLTVSKNELFRFTPDGKLLVHSINNVIYDENGNVIGTAGTK